jgi:cytochrome c2
VIERNLPPAPAAVAMSGEAIFRSYQCTSCHGDKGLGVCDLRSAGTDYRTDADLAAFIREPSRFVPGTKMPTWNGVLRDADYPPLIAYVRSLQNPGDAKP